MRTAFVGLLLLTSCASTPPAPPASSSPEAPGVSSAALPSPSAATSSSTPTDATASSAPAAPPTGPVPIGGSVLVGEINAPPHFDPKPTIVALEPKLLDCFNQARASNPSLHGKLTLHIVVNEAGAGLSADADPGGNAYDPALVKCIDGVVKAGVKFPKPGGTATVSAPLVFRP